MSISKPENTSQSTERDDELEHERAGHGGAFENGAFENGYGYGRGGEHEPESESGLEGEDAASQHTMTGAMNRDLRAHDGERAEENEGAFESGAEQEPRATTLSTAEPAAMMGHGRTDSDGIYRDGTYRDNESEPGALDQGSAIGRGDEGLNEDSMFGDAAQTRPRSTPMRPAPAQETSSPATPTAQSQLATDPGPVLAPEASLDFRERWHGIQAEFIDDPRRAVEDADRLVADVARAFTSSVEERRRGLTSGWQNDERGETEELRLTMRQYRALVDHILQD